MLNNHYYIYPAVCFTPSQPALCNFGDAFYGVDNCSLCRKNVTGRQVRWLHADRPLLAKQSENVTDLYLPLDVISEKLVSETSTIIQTATVPATFGSINIYRPVVLGITQPTAHHAEVFCRLMAHWREKSVRYLELTPGFMAKHSFVFAASM